jgi:hypothetical protein
MLYFKNLHIQKNTKLRTIYIIIINLILIKPKAIQVSYLGLKAKENLIIYLCTK